MHSTTMIHPDTIDPINVVKNGSTVYITIDSPTGYITIFVPGYTPLDKEKWLYSLIAKLVEMKDTLHRSPNDTD